MPSCPDGGADDECNHDSLHPSSFPLPASGGVLDRHDAIDDRKRDKRNAEWEAERQQLEKERAQRDKEYHERRMKQLEEE